MQNLILASSSAIRLELLRNAGLAVEAWPAKIDEAAVKAGMLAEGAPPIDVADKLAEMKALRVSARHPQDLVLGADQVLVFENQIFDKPTTFEDAANHLRMLRGKPHQLMSASVICEAGRPVWRHVGKARLTMRRFSDEFLSDYLHQIGEEAFHSVGAYKLEALGAQLFSQIQGDYFTILGLPLLEVLGYLRARGICQE